MSNAKAMSLKAKIRNIAKSKNLPAQVILQNYMFERFLNRLSASEYKEKFVLKGGMLVAAIVGIDNRATMDLDTTLKNLPLTPEAIEKALNEIFEIDLNDEDYNELKKVAFDFANEIFIQHIEGLMPSRLSELDIYVSGGGSLNLNRLDDRFMRVENPLFSVAKGLYYIGKIILM